MSNSSSKKYVYDTTVPNIGFEFREFSTKVTIIGYVFAQFLEQITKFLFFIRAVYHVFEPSKEDVIEGFLEQIDEGNPEDWDFDYNWDEHFNIVFSWEEQEKLISELIFTKIVNRYITYLTDMASYVIDKTQLSLDKKNILRSFSKIKKCYRDHFNTSLYLTPEDETLADQLISLRNLIVHSLNYLPENYYPKFHNWEELGCIKKDSDIFYIEFDYSSLERFGIFLTKSVADIDSRLSKNCNIDVYYFDEDDIPKEYESFTEIIDEEFYDEE